jgi:HK97 gp10 family phage protein
MSINLDIFDPNIKTKLATLPEKMLEYAEEVLLKQAQLMRDLAKIYCPVDTGSLRDSIRVERGGSGLRWREVRVRAGGYVTNPNTGRKVDYAYYQEYGTRYMVAKMFMQMAYLQVQPSIEAMIKAEVAQKI